MTAVRAPVRNYPKEVRDEYRAFIASGRTAMEHAFRCGELLVEIKATLPHGDFQPWIAQHCEFSYPTAHRYMGFARQVGKISVLRDLPDDAYAKFLPPPKSPGGDSKVALYSSETDQWETPRALFAVLDAEFAFELDVCASHSNAKCKKFLSTDALDIEWKGSCWMNPPYGGEIAAWIEKAFTSAQKGATVVCLVPARVDTAWWWDYCAHGEIRFLRGRLKFGESETGAPFPSAVVIFRPNQRRLRSDTWNVRGWEWRKD